MGKEDFRNQLVEKIKSLVRKNPDMVSPCESSTKHLYGNGEPIVDENCNEFRTVRVDKYGLMFFDYIDKDGFLVEDVEACWKTFPETETLQMIAERLEQC